MNNISDDDTWISLGVLAEKSIKSGDTAAAKQLLLNSISLKPTQAWPYFLLSSIVEDNDEAIELIRLTKNIETTEWYYINLIERYSLQLDILKKEFLEKYNKDTLKDDSAIIRWRQLSGFKDFIMPISNISIEDCNIISNRWECITILCTGKEYINNTYLKFIQNIVDVHDASVSKNLDLKFVIKSSDKHKYHIPHILSHIFKSVCVIDIDIPVSLDIYDNKQDTASDSNIIKTYGSKYGPNFIFFETMKQLSHYNTSLLLECDCMLLPKWMERINNYISSQSLLISGSQADSPNKEDFNDIRNKHINGGTAIYATGNILFQKFINICEKLWPVYIEHKSIDLPYDYILLLILEDYFNHVTNKEDKIIWSYIKKHYIYNTLISNWSDTTYADYDPRVVSQRTQTAILHQKPMDYPGL
jgi:hypothetical protein